MKLYIEFGLWAKPLKEQVLKQGYQLSDDVITRHQSNGNYLVAMRRCGLISVSEQKKIIARITKALSRNKISLHE